MLPERVICSVNLDGEMFTEGKINYNTSQFMQSKRNGSDPTVVNNALVGDRIGVYVCGSSMGRRGPNSDW